MWAVVTHALILMRFNQTTVEVKVCVSEYTLPFYDFVICCPCRDPDAASVYIRW